MPDLQSILGYQRGSPYAGNPYLDINTPEGLIDMSNTPIDLIGIDNKGNKKKMKAGRKNPYRFEGDIVREYPMQMGGTTAPRRMTPEEIVQFNSFNQFVRDKGYAKADTLNNQQFSKGLYSEYRKANPNVALDYETMIPMAQQEQYFVKDYSTGLSQRRGENRTAIMSNITPFDGKYGPLTNGYDIPPVFVQNQNTGVAKISSDAGRLQNTQRAFSPPPGAKIEELAGGKKGYWDDKAGVMREFKMGGTNPYYQKGGFNAKDLYKYLFDDDNEGYEEGEDYEENENTAPAAVEVQGVEENLPEPDDSQIALQMAMQQDELLVASGNPYVKDVASARAVGENPYTPVKEASMSNPSRYAFEYFQKKGLPPHIAAGIVGNLIQESGNFRPDVITDDITGDNGASHGIAQWQKDRWPAYLRWASSQGKNPKELDSQLEYVYVEATQRGDLSKVSTAKTSSEAANLFAKYYERPAIIDKHRANNARQLYPD